MMEKSDLLALAREYAPKHDLYSLLNIDSLTAKEEKEVQRAWRKTSVKYHPDKAGAAFDAEKWQLLERARDILLDNAAREAYDAARGAALQREMERQAMDAKRRAMVEDLEARERGEIPPSRRKVEPTNVLTEEEKRKLAEQARKRREERDRQLREALERERERERKEDEARDAREAELERKLRERQEKRAAKAPKAQTESTPQVPRFSFKAPEVRPPKARVNEPGWDAYWSSLKARLKDAQAEREKWKSQAAAGAAQ